ncbi:MAG: Flp pilus assembly complex ATPase component TadA [Alphaproteobacteria bacterium]|nr:Flp pilus assembly complex ATPase component TadA [Alphaproteobacteria bacterium]
MSNLIEQWGEKLKGLGKKQPAPTPAKQSAPAVSTGASPPAGKTFKKSLPASTDQAQNQAAAVQAQADNAVKIEDERKIALSFNGDVLTAEGGELKVPEEARSFCALFSNGLWLVSASHRRSPLVTSVAQAAKRQGIKVDEPRYVTPNIIVQAYLYADRKNNASQFDDNAVRRRIVATLDQAVQMGANDIHIESVNGRAVVQYRIDGALRQIESWTQREGEQFLAAVYSHSIGQSGATANWQEPQAAMLTSDARGKEVIALPKGVISVRCQWVPLANDGRYLDMRLQYDSAHLFGENFVMADVDSLGFSQEQLKVVQSLRASPGGLRIFSGPVNQGKTTTLRVTLNRRMSETEMRLNCLLIEDPPEGGIIGARQIGVSASVKDEQREKTFVEIMRCALRLDPDIVMLGEIRDLQTAKFAFRLALTGRQVYTTGHVYSALATPKRLRDIGIEPYIVYDHHLVRGMACQRLLRSQCQHCRIPLKEMTQSFNYPMIELARRLRAGLALMKARRNPANAGKPPLECLVEPDLGNVYVANPDGCPKCYKGRSGRTVCAEIIETDIKLMELLQDNRMEEAEQYWLSPAGLNGITMLWRGMEKTALGEVSPDDAEFELGPFAREREVLDVEQKLGPMR